MRLLYILDTYAELRFIRHDNSLCFRNSGIELIELILAEAYESIFVKIAGNCNYYSVPGISLSVIINHCISADSHKAFGSPENCSLQWIVVVYYAGNCILHIVIGSILNHLYLLQHNLTFLFKLLLIKSGVQQHIK